MNIKLLVITIPFLYIYQIQGVLSQEELQAKLKAGIEQGVLEKVQKAVSKDKSILKLPVIGTDTYKSDKRGKKVLQKGPLPLVYALNQKEINPPIVMYLLQQIDRISDDALKKLFQLQNESLIKQVIEYLYPKKIPQNVVSMLMLGLKTESIVQWITKKKAFDITQDQANNFLFSAIKNKVSLTWVKYWINTYHVKLTITKPYSISKQKKAWYTIWEISTQAATPLYAALMDGTNECIDYILKIILPMHLKQATFSLTGEVTEFEADLESRSQSLKDRYKNYDLAKCSYITIALFANKDSFVPKLIDKGIKPSELDIALAKEKQAKISLKAFNQLGLIS